MKTKLNLIFASGLLLIVVLGCNFSASTANISNLKVGKDKDIGQEASTFSPTDTIYSVATISNSISKVKVKGKLTSDDGGSLQPLEKTLDLDGSGTATYTFTPPPGGWPKGKYKIEVIMMDESGAQKDSKTATVTVS